MADECINLHEFYFMSLAESQVAAQSSINCPESNGEVSWIQYKDSCYAIVMTMSNYTVFSIEHAQNICKDLGMYLHLKFWFKRYLQELQGIYSDFSSICKLLMFFSILAVR